MGRGEETVALSNFTDSTSVESVRFFFDVKAYYIMVCLLGVLMMRWFSLWKILNFHWGGGGVDEEGGYSHRAKRQLG